MCTHDSLFSEHGPRARNSFSAIFRLGTHGVKYERTCTIAHVLKPLNFHIRNWMFISRDVLDCQDFEDKILVLLSKFKILKKISLSLLDWMRFCKQILFSRVKILREKKSICFSRLFPQFLFQFWWEIIFCYLVGFWPAVFCRKGKYFKKTALCCWAIF